MKKVFLLTLAVLMIASIAFAGVGKRYVLLYPPPVASSDSTLTSISVASRAVDLTEQLPGVEAIKWSVGVTTADTDIDSVSYFARVSFDGANWITVNSDVNTASTVAGTTWGGAFSSDSTYFGAKYFQIIGLVAGDDAGTAIQTIYITPTVIYTNGVGEVIKIKGATPIECSFKE